MNPSDQIPKLFRTEYSKLVAVLCKAFGLSNIQIAEDAVGDTFLLATENWAKNGLPDNPTAWLYTVAKNKIRDYLKRQKIRVEKIEPFVKSQQEEQYELKFDLSKKNIQDSQLQMIFTVCHPSLTEEAQISLALRILCGFGIDEISTALLSNKSTINKRLFRAKQKLREANINIELPEKEEIGKRLDTVLTTLYLLFNEGYYSAAVDKTLRKDFCLEAMRLTLLLTQNAQTNLPKVNALLSLMCFHASRFEARLDEDNNFVLYNKQDRNLWDKKLIIRGKHFLNTSSAGEKLSKYHLEAAIAFWHTQSDSSEKWDNILQLYNYLLQVEYSPIAALNRTYALAQVKGKKRAITEALKINLSQNLLYHSLLADLYDGVDDAKRLEHLKLALSLAKSEQERKVVLDKMSK
ncbi:MAG: RNA polymerase sigma factor (sigma-70 family) [Saprospiraceae bacterium]|jgi:RNA polymerase sigma factor (sigma-70 family)